MNPNMQTNSPDQDKAHPQLRGERFETQMRQDAVSLLRADHDKVIQLFSYFDSAVDDSEKLELAQTICTELKIHATIEEEIFYPAAREALGEDELLDEAAVEHDSARELIAQIEASYPDDDKWQAKVKVLSEYIKHHVNEEQTKLFPAAQASDMDLDQLGEAMLERKQELADELADESQDLFDDDGR